MVIGSAIAQLSDVLASLGSFFSLMTKDHPIVYVISSFSFLSLTFNFLRLLNEIDYLLSLSHVLSRCVSEKCAQNKHVQAVTDRIAEVSRVPYENSEYLQVLHYKVSELHTV